jgi:L1 cell adhesion molecule like protein
LSAEEIDKMVKEAELFKEQDEENRGKIEAKNSLENYLYSMRNNITDEKAAQFPEDLKNTIKEHVDEGLKWLEDNQHETKSVYDDKMKEFQDKITPLLSSAAGSSGPPGGFDPSQFAQQGGNFSSPPPQTKEPEVKIEEVD